jgi:ribosomal protein S14
MIKYELTGQDGKTIRAVSYPDSPSEWERDRVYVSLDGPRKGTLGIVTLSRAQVRELAGELLARFSD